MLLIDGVRYQEWEISNEDELEQMVIEHAQDIFGENSIYFDKKQKLKSLAGVGSIPDGLVIMFGSVPQWRIVEVELSSHDPYAHIVPQVDKFINGIDNQNTRNKLVDTLYNLINSDELLRRETRQAIGLDKDIHKFLADLITTPPTITIIIEKDTDQLEDALRKYAQKKVIEFQTFRRVGAESVHAHLFEPLYQPHNKIPGGEIIIARTTMRPDVTKRVTIKDLMDSGIVKSGQTIYGWHKGKKYEAIILFTGEIELAHTHDGSVYNSPSAAGKRILGHEIDGWTWWRTTRANNEECLLDELRKEYRATHP
jgi:hypothetical protein